MAFGKEGDERQFIIRMVISIIAPISGLQERMTDFHAANIIPKIG
jgi:hypothetical protein